LYAKQDRYITDDRTRHLSEMSYFSCNCEVCSRFTPKELFSLKQQERTNEIALHNLYAIKAEVDRVKESIHEGRLWEYTMKKMRSHPKLFEVIDVFVRNYTYFENTTPVFKEKAVFLFSKEDQFRPEVQNYHRIVRKFSSKKRILCMVKDTQIKPAYLSPQYTALKKKFKDPEKVQFCQYNPFLGIIPFEISDIFPASHYLSSNRNYEPKDFTEFEKTWNVFFAKNNFAEIYFDKNNLFLNYFVKQIPKGIRKKSL
ncbi:MAG: tRNA guanosine(15) transglycosylase TgtA, partial [Nitrosopumilaceae archaeon]|nr:tRNA guanosine(15) transglycosylase TgtA [Nitrosopumilaceae archaeon]